MRIGKMLKVWRAWNEVSVRDMASEIGISAATLSRIERGYEMDARTLLKVIQWLGCRTH